MIYATSGFVASVGLVLDISGALFLTNGIWKGPEQRKREASDYMDGNPFRLQSSVYQAGETWIGFSYLFLGFASEFLSESSVVDVGVDRYPLWIIVFGLLQLLFMFIFLRRFNRQRSRTAVIEQFGGGIRRELSDQTKSEAQRVTSAEFYGSALDLRRKAVENDTAFIERVLAFVQTRSSD